ncbi:MAG: molecular chaperone TorD family protein [Nitrospirota bacterium]
MNDLYEITEARMHVYNLLRRIYAAGPTLEFTSNLGNAMLEYLSDVESIREGSRMVSMACREVRNEKDLDDLHVEFARLFLFGKMPAPPYESVYQGEGGCLMGEPAIAVRREYLKEGLQVERLYSEPDDHIAIEFEFMAFLCNKALSALKNQDNNEADKLMKKQKDFMEMHIAKWVPSFCDSVLNATKGRFYGGIALFTKSFVIEDSGFLIELYDMSEVKN